MVLQVLIKFTAVKRHFKMKNEKIAKHITGWLSRYLDKSGARGFVVGVSGGVDSALVSVLCAMTGRSTVCVTMPIHQAKSHVARAGEHCSYLVGKYANVTCENIDLTAPFDAFAAALPVCGDEARDNLASANTRSRMRMTALYHVASLGGLLVAGTGNKIEDFGVGFFTKWGDGGVDLSPIADLTKTQVYELARYVGVCENILSAEPSDGLFDTDRTDSMQLGATYPELEWAMDMAELGFSQADFTGRKAEVMDIFIRRKRANAHKMKPIPVCRIPKGLLV